MSKCDDALITAATQNLCLMPVNNVHCRPTNTLHWYTRGK